MGRQTRHFFPQGPRPKFAFEVMKSSRAVYSTLCQLITGHNYMNRHQHIIDTTNRVEGREGGPICTKCRDGEMSTQHVIGECGAFNYLRHKHFQQFQLQPPFDNLSRSSLVGFCKEWQKCSASRRRDRHWSDDEETP